MPSESSHPQQSASNTAAESPVGARSPVVVVSSGGRHTVWWVMTVCLAVIATVLVVRRDDSLIMRSAHAQPAGAGGPGQAGARGIYAFPAQLTAKSYGLFMMDVDTGTIWCYEMEKGAGGKFQLSLVAARSWIFDRYLEEFNVAEPVPGAVRLMVQQQRSHREDVDRVTNKVDEAAGSAMPDGDGS